MTTAPFWMIWRPAFGPPTRKHPTKADALAEAVRLATANPGAEFYVLQCIGSATLPRPVAVWSGCSEEARDV